MIDMELLNVFKRWYFRDGMPIRQTARQRELELLYMLTKYLNDTASVGSTGGSKFSANAIS